MVSLRERSVIFTTFLLACLGLGLLASGLGSSYWLEANLEFAKVNKTDSASSGYTHFGLFRGYKCLNRGYGDREKNLNILDILYNENTFMVKGLYVATIICICVSMLFGIAAAISAVINTAYTPSESVCHIPGMYHYF